MDLGSIQTNRPQFQHTRLLSEREDLHDEVFELGQECASKGGQRIVVGMQVPAMKRNGTASYVARSILCVLNTPVA